MVKVYKGPPDLQGLKDPRGQLDRKGRWGQSALRDRKGLRDLRENRAVSLLLVRCALKGSLSKDSMKMERSCALKSTLTWVPIVLTILFQEQTCAIAI
jgi:hypothetical protein